MIMRKRLVLYILVFIKYEALSQIASTYQSFHTKTYCMICRKVLVLVRRLNKKGDWQYTPV